MTQQQPAMSHFDAAKLIFEALKGLDKQSQTLAMRFASETLGLQSAVGTQTPAALVAATLPPVSQPDIRGATHSTDIKQFTETKAPQSDQQFAAVVAYFYRFEAPETARLDAINANTLKEAARLAGRRQAKNWQFTLNNAKKSGYLDTAGTGQFKINSVGENLVAMTLPGNASEVPPKRKTQKMKNANKRGTKKNNAKKKKGTKKNAKTSG